MRRPSMMTRLAVEDTTTLSYEHAVVAELVVLLHAVLAD